MQSINSSLAGLEYHLKSGRIITGQEEAVSGWVAGNFLSHSLKSVSAGPVSCDVSADFGVLGESVWVRVCGCYCGNVEG